MNWVLSGKLVDSFIAKSFTVLAMSSIVLSSATKLSSKSRYFDQIIDETNYYYMYYGAIIFIIGVIVHELRRPIEFSSSESVEKTVSTMKSVESRLSYDSRIKLTKGLLERSQNQLKILIPKAEVTAAEIVIKTIGNSATNWKDDSALLYNVDINLRKFDRPVSRMACATLLFSGVILTCVPIIRRVIDITTNGVCQMVN